jgi:hypothetical protein
MATNTHKKKRYISISSSENADNYIANLLRFHMNISEIEKEWYDKYPLHNISSGKGYAYDAYKYVLLSIIKRIWPTEYRGTYKLYQFLTKLQAMAYGDAVYFNKNDKDIQPFVKQAELYGVNIKDPENNNQYKLGTNNIVELFCKTYPDMCKQRVCKWGKYCKLHNIDPIHRMTFAHPEKSLRRSRSRSPLRSSRSRSPLRSTRRRNRFKSKIG